MYSSLVHLWRLPAILGAPPALLPFPLPLPAPGIFCWGEIDKEK